MILPQSSLRQSTRPRRYNDEVYDDDEFGSPSRGRGSVGLGANGGGGDDEYPSDEEGDGLLRATAHIWREPLQAYITDLHARRRQVEQDVEAAEASRKFVVAARAVDMTAQRIPAMRARREIRAVEIKHENEVRAREEALAQQRAAQEDEKRQRKEVDKEERLRKQRDAARKKREEDRLKREHDNEQRRLRAEEARIAKLAEAERKAALTPEQREAEDRALADKLAREREEAALRSRAAEEELLATGRGARKRRRPLDGTGDPEEDAALALSSMYAEYDELDDDEDAADLFDAPGSKGRKGKGSSRRGSSFAPEPFVLPPGAYTGPDGQYYDATGQPLIVPPPGASRHGSPHDDGDFLGDDQGGDMVKQKKPIEELERKVWLQIARKDIPKVRPPFRLSPPSAPRPPLLTLSSCVCRSSRSLSSRRRPASSSPSACRPSSRARPSVLRPAPSRPRTSRRAASASCASS